MIEPFKIPWRKEEDYIIDEKGQTAMYNTSGGKRGRYKPTAKEILEWSLR